jgi:hypothetical protein
MLLSMSKKNIYVIPDPQIRPGVRSSLIVCAHDIVATRPDVVVCLGDLFDMPSLSAYDKGKISFNSRRYIADIDAGNAALFNFWQIINKGQKKYPKWKCRFIITLGNHEFRINKAIEFMPPELQGLMDLHQPDFTGFDVVAPFLKPVIINGVAFVHYLANEFSHKQVLDYAEKQTLDGKRIMGLIVGACYYHDESYKGHQNNRHFRGTVYLRNVYAGQLKNIR